MNSSADLNPNNPNELGNSDDLVLTMTPTRGMQTVTYLPEQLDENTLNYLRDVRYMSGVSFGGWYAKRNAGGVFIAFLVGLAIVGASFFWELALQKHPGHPPLIGILQKVLFVIAAVVTIVSGYMMINRNRRGAIGDFKFVDAVFYWDVSPYRVKATRIDTVQSTHVTHQYYNSVYQGSTVNLYSPQGKLSISVAGEYSANMLQKFLNCCIQLKDDRYSGRSADLQTNPTMRGAAARMMADQIPESSWQFADFRPIAIPVGRPAPLLRSDVRIGVTATLVAAIFAYTYFPMVVNYLGDEWDFSRIQANPGDLVQLADYIKHYPKGRHRDQAFELQDHGMWKQAKFEAELAHSPAKLRAYLAVATNTRHRDEATHLISSYYDEAIGRIKDLAAAGKNVDPTIFNAMLAILQGLKQSQDSIVTIGFVAKTDPLPATAELKQQERGWYEAYRQQFGASFADLEQASPDRSAIRPLGEVFDPAQLRHREAVILKCLSTAVERVLTADIITFKSVAPEEQPHILCNYHINNSGSFYTQSTGGGQDGDNGPLVLHGMFRSYRIAWSLTFRPPFAVKAYEKKFGSRPASSFSYRDGPGDPDWAPYAIMMYSAFHDFASELVRGFGLKPPRQPNSFTFNDATGTNEVDDDGRLVPDEDDPEVADADEPAADAPPGRPGAMVPPVALIPNGANLPAGQNGAPRPGATKPATGIASVPAGAKNPAAKPAGVSTMTPKTTTAKPTTKPATSAAKPATTTRPATSTAAKPKPATTAKPTTKPTTTKPATKPVPGKPTTTTAK